MLNKKI